MKKIKQIMYGGTDSKGEYSTIVALTEDGRLWSSGGVCLFRESDYENINWHEIPTPTDDCERDEIQQMQVRGTVEIGNDLNCYNYDCGKI